MTDDIAAIEAMFESYCTAFERRDANALASHFAFPCHIAGDAARPVLRAFADPAEYTATIATFLDGYRRAGVAQGDILRLAVRHVGPRIARADIRWRVRGATGPLYDFDAVYTLAKQDSWRIAAIAHNELPQLQAVLALKSST